MPVQGAAAGGCGTVAEVSGTGAGVEGARTEGPPTRALSRSSNAIDAAPGTASSAIAGHSAPVRAATAATSSGPAKAPTWSSALCTANPRPRPTALAAWASSVDFDGLRTALPVRSARTSAQASTRPAAPTNGVSARAGTHTAVSA